MSDKKTILEILDFEELEILENLVGKEYHEIFGKGLSAKASYSLHWILEKRSNPDAKIEVSKKKNLAFLNEYLKGFLNDPKES
jgi:hypothetical protein